MIRRQNAVLALAFSVFSAMAIPAGAAINAGDRLNVHIYNHPELSIVATVDSSGSIQIPVVGTVHAAGLESNAVAYVIRKRIEPYVPFPAVDVQDTSETQSLFVSGASGGVLAYSPNETLSAAVAEVQKAGTIAGTNNVPPSPNALIDRFDSSRLDLRRVIVYRSGRALGAYNVIALRDAGDPGPVLYANDTVAFSNKPIAVKVVGAVNLPGPAYLWADEPLSDAIAQSGGVSGVAASNRIVISRPDAADQIVAFGNAAFNEPAKDGDIITVPTAPRVTVAGMVDKPGTVILPSDFTLVSALAAAGGYNRFGDLRNVQVVHQGVTTHYNIVALAHGDLTNNPALSDGDTVYVPEGHKTDWSLVWSALGGIGGISTLYYNVVHH